MWKLQDANSEITISEIKNFAEYQFCDMGDDDPGVYIDSEYLPDDVKEFAVINPWIDSTGRFPLTAIEAEQEYSKAGVENFVMKAEEYLKKHRLLAWAQGMNGKDAWTAGLFRDTNTDGTVTYHIDKSGDETISGRQFSEKEAWDTYNSFIEKHKHKSEITPEEER